MTDEMVLSGTLAKMTELTVEEVLRYAFPLNTVVAAGAAHLTRTVRWVALADSAERPPYLEGGEIVLLIPGQGEAARFIAACAARGASALAVPQPFDPVLCDAAESAGLALLAPPPSTRLRDVERNILSLLLDRQHHADRLSAQIHQQLVQIASENTGLGPIINHLAQAVDKGVVVQDKNLRILHESPSPDLAKVWDTITEDFKERKRLPELIRDRHRLPRGATSLALQAIGGAFRMIVPIVNHGVGRGYLSLVAAESSQFDEVDHLVIHHAGVICALEMARAKAISEIEKKARGHFLTNLMTGTLSEAEAQAAIERLGHDVNAPHIALVARWYGEQTPSLRRLETLVNSVVVTLGVQALTQFYENEVRIFYATNGHDPVEAARSFGEHLIEAAHRENRHARLGVGIGPVAMRVWEWRNSYQGAAQASEIAKRLGAEVPLYASDIDIYTLLLRSNFQEDLRALRDKTLGALLRHEEKQRADLLQTLEAFFACHGNHNQTAAMLSVHRNTLFYRMNRIAEITGLDLNQPDVRLAVHLSLKIHRLLTSAF